MCIRDRSQRVVAPEQLAVDEQGRHAEGAVGERLVGLRLEPRLHRLGAGRSHERGPGITEPEVVATLATDAGFDGPAAPRAAGTEPVKARLKAQTDEALAHGAFGVPTLLVDGELFWGYDSLGPVSYTHLTLPTSDLV